MKLLTWPDLERAAVAAGWKRRGVEYHGPCPIADAGRDCAWVGPGRDGGVRLGCRWCGGGLDGKAFAAHLQALGIDDHRDNHPCPPRPRRRPRGDAVPASSPNLNPLPARVWRATKPLHGTPGAKYLRYRVPNAPTDHPRIIRWLPTALAGDLRPRLPAEAVGCIVYAYRAPTDVVGENLLAAQCEALNEGGDRVTFDVAGKRPSVFDSDFAGGARVFRLCETAPRRDRVWLAEGPLDVLALACLVPDGDAVIGAAGTSGFTPKAVAGWPGTVVIAPDADVAGRAAAVRLRQNLRLAGRRSEIRRPPAGDWCDLWID